MLSDLVPLRWGCALPSPNEDVTHRPASKIQEIHTGSRTPSSTQLTPPASLHSSVGAPPNTHSGPRTVHASQQDCNRCAQVHRPTGPSLADIGPHHRPNTQPAFLSRSEERAWKLAAHPREPGSQGLLDPRGRRVGGQDSLPILSQCMSWGKGLVPFPETVPFFP